MAKQSTQEKIAALLEVSPESVAYLQALPEEDGAALTQLVERAIEERRHVILQALDDAGKFLPGPLRRKLAQRIQGD